MVAVAAAEPERPLLLLTPWGAAGQGGPAYYLEIIAEIVSWYPDRDITGVLDCADDAALAHFALAMGWRCLVFDGNDKARERLRETAKKLDAAVLESRPKGRG